MIAKATNELGLRYYVTYYDTCAPAGKGDSRSMLGRFYAPQSLKVIITTCIEVGARAVLRDAHGSVRGSVSENGGWRLT
jgi:hypothetical protein